MIERLAVMRRILPVIGRDIAGVAGAGLIATGCGAIYVPIGMIVGGILLVAAAFLLARRP